MRWDALEAPPEKFALARELVRICSARGWGRAALRAAAEIAFQDPERWRLLFPAGPRDAIWFISEVSDASMKAAFEHALAGSMSEVILERLSQNTALKPFVRRIMLFDLLHPLQALARMQRTSRVMLACLRSHSERAQPEPVTLLNLAYTVIVFAWLFDPEGEGGLTRCLTARLMATLKL
jgi:hypothetical protein